MDSQPLRHDAFNAHTMSQGNIPAGQRGNVVKTGDGRTLNTVPAAVNLTGKNERDIGEKSHSEEGLRTLKRSDDGKGCLVSAVEQKRYCNEAVWMLGVFKDEISEACNKLNEYCASNISNVSDKSCVSELKVLLNASQDKHDECYDRAVNGTFTLADFRAFREKQQELGACYGRFLELMKPVLVSATLRSSEKPESKPTKNRAGYPPIPDKPTQQELRECCDRSLKRTKKSLVSSAVLSPEKAECKASKSSTSHPQIPVKPTDLKTKYFESMSIRQSLEVRGEHSSSRMSVGGVPSANRPESSPRLTASMRAPGVVSNPLLSVGDEPRTLYVTNLSSDEKSQTHQAAKKPIPRKLLNARLESFFGNGIFENRFRFHEISLDIDPTDISPTGSIYFSHESDCSSEEWGSAEESSLSDEG